ncbi:hypothetical protein ACFPVS_08985 [Neisseria weixii]|uniref:phage tail terminator protein n=1 Tax=Neisseria weixii TaxID=1853276 RepID=UPI003614F8B2
MLKQHGNLLAVYPLILERMATVDGVKAVKEIGDLAEMLAAAKEKRRVSPLDGAVYVVYGGETVADTANRSGQTKHTLHFTFVLAKTYTAGGKSPLYEAGAVLTAIQTAFAGWDAGREYAASEFRREPSPAIEYNDGYAFFPISFAADVVVKPN